ncbi:MAG TPA: MarR family transcriptional regulator [Polyangiaceae bacterium]|jgi:DNA-binding MarR family transcriptional regulator|nr:MarR family transcriptional regulator [Polyangiaceae bacterium]
MQNVPASVANELLELDNQICFALHSTARQLVRAYRPALEGLELTHPQYLVMLVLWGWAKDREQRPTVKALGDRLLLDSGTLTPLLKRLQSRGLITRTRSSTDEREVFVHLTRAGQSLKKRAVRVPMTLLEQSRMPLGELVELREGLKRLRSVLKPAEARP